MTSSFLLAFAAGVFSTLSPCVLPILPVILAAAVSESRLGPLALATGLGLSFIVIGMMLAVAGSAIGLDQSPLRAFAGMLLIVIQDFPHEFREIRRRVGGSGRGVE